MNKTIAVLMIAAVTLGLGTSADADVIALYDFVDADLSSADTNAFTTAGDLQFGAGITATEIKESGSQNGVSFGNPLPALYIDSANTVSTSESESAAVDNAQYIEFTITPTSTMTLETLSLDYAVFADPTGGGKSLDILGFVRSSLTGSDNLLFWDPGNVVGQTSKDWETLSVDLTDGGTDSTFADLAGPVTFQIYLAENKNQGGRGTGFDNIKVEGVPEPATMSLLAIGGLGVLLRRRRR